MARPRHLRQWDACQCRKGFQMSDPSRLTATDAAARIRAGTLSPVALAEACLDRIARREPAIHAFAHLDAAGAKAAAEAAARAPASGALHGVPVGVKDVIDVAGLPTTQGSPIWTGWRPRADAAAVAWVRAAGAVVLGKTVTTEFATRQPGPTANPHNDGHTPGGSSSGSAAGVADFMVPVAFGTQTAGSVIRPAAYCGVVGYKPSFGTINRTGMRVMSDSLDTIGAIARSVADCALFVAAASGRDLGDPDRKPDRAPRIGLCRSPAWGQALPETQALLPAIADRLARAGAAVSPRELPPEAAALEHAQPVVMNAEAARSMGWELANARGQISDILREKLDWGLARPDAELAAAYAAFAAAHRGFPAAMEGLDILVTPSAPGQAPAGLGWTGDPCFNLIWTALHVPCVTVPAGFGPDGLPLGIQIVGRRGDDRAVLAWAQWVAAAIG
jgi:Asp-tRNA(Asn)/Glu-tRNA(Gln) amidotransferase A subunit family amidase